MELKARIFATLLLFFLLVPPCFSRGKLHVKSVDSEVYVIDYRGPETHTSIPPPNRAGGGRPNIHHHTNMARLNKSKLITKEETNGKKIHG
ncbi:hypothetical protein ACJIZ3_021952 [Penstemon smallii]|uniref:Uncharacterized protein n=1 Tax=Penstemon smallii TaxID=265156 RepID=A0ABD3SN52_9LAMI